MDFFQAIVLGIVQGLTEFLPISSTGHLRIVPAFMGWEDPGAAFTAVTQLGTMAAVLLYFRADLWRIVTAFLRGLRDPSERRGLDFRMGVLIIIGTIPISIFGFAFRHQIEDSARSLTLIGTTLIVLGLALLLAEKVGRRDRVARHDLDPRRHRDRLRPGARARPGRLALGRDADGGNVPGLRPRVGGALLVPALGARRGAQRRLRAAQHRRRGRRGLRGDGARDRHGLHLRLRDDRLPPALAREPLDGDLRRLPDRARHPRARARRRGR